jgi:hypothetical protein
VFAASSTPTAECRRSKQRPLRRSPWCARSSSAEAALSVAGVAAAPAQSQSLGRVGPCVQRPSVDSCKGAAGSRRPTPAHNSFRFKPSCAAPRRHATQRNACKRRLICRPYVRSVVIPGDDAPTRECPGRSPTARGTPCRFHDSMPCRSPSPRSRIPAARSLTCLAHRRSHSLGCRGPLGTGSSAPRPAVPGERSNRSPWT